MGLKRVEERLLRLSKMVEKWNSSGRVPHIERDLALDELREIYDALLNAECGVPYTPAPLHAKTKAKSEPQPVAEPEPQPHHKVDPIADFDDALDIDALLGLTDEDLAPEPELEPQPEPTPVAEPAPAPVAQPEPEPAPAPAPNPGGGLFAIEDIPVRSKSSRKMINLYNSSPSSVEVAPMPTPTPTPAPQPAYNPAPQPVYAPAPAQQTYIEPQPMVAAVDSSVPQRLGDVLGSGKKIVGQMQSIDNAPIAPMNKISDLRKAIGINDKFLLLRDLFNGDVPLYERTIDTLNAFEDLDECMIYIVENFRWNPDSEGAKMLVSLIERKLS